MVAGMAYVAMGTAVGCSQFTHSQLPLRANVLVSLTDAIAWPAVLAYNLNQAARAKPESKPRPVYASSRIPEEECDTVSRYT